MLAAVSTEYGPADVVRLQDRPVPSPGPGEILVRVEAAGVTTADWRLRAAAFPGVSALFGRLMFGVRRPKQAVRGTDFAGRVAQIGSGVKRFSVGDRVVGVLPGGGAHAEALVVEEDGVVAHRPASLPAAEAAALPFGALAAKSFLFEAADLRSGEEVLVLGASGAVGGYVVQLAHAAGARVTAVGGTAAQDRLRTLGADRVIDYTRERVEDGRDRYDLVLDTAGLFGFVQARRVLRPSGRFVPLEFGLGEVLRGVFRRRGPTVKVHISGETRADLEWVLERVARGALRPVVGARLPFDEIVEAHRRVESRNAGGPVVVEMAMAAPHAAAA